MSSHRVPGKMSSYVWRKYADYLFTKWEKTFLWDMVEPYRRPKPFTPVVVTYVAAFYTGVIGAAITEQLYKILTLRCLVCLLVLGYILTEKYWEENPGKAVPLMKPTFYGGPWRVMGGEIPRYE